MNIKALLLSILWTILNLGQYFLCGYTFYTSINFTYSLFTSYIYLANHEWCYYPMILTICSIFTSIAFNFMYTFYFIDWLVTNTGISFNTNNLFIITKSESPYTSAVREGKNLLFMILIFVSRSVYKILDLLAYTNSTLVMNLIMGRSADVITGIGINIVKDNPKKQTILRKMSLTILISMFFMDLPQGIVSIYTLYENGNLEFDLSDFTSFNNVKNSASFTILRIIISVLLSGTSFISTFFFDTKNAVRDSQLKLLG